MAEGINVTHGAFSIGTNHQPILGTATIATSTPSLKRTTITTAAVPASTVNIQLDGINTLFFDLDNTLIPTRAGDLKTIRKLSDVLENQFTFSKEESSLVTQTFLKAFRRCPDNSQTSLDSWRTYLWREALPNRYKHLAEQIYPKWLQLRYRYLAMPNEFIQMLRRFREARFLLGLITNGPSNAQWEKINKLHVSQHFDCVLVSSDLPWEKPHPNIFLAACNFLGVKPAECAMIGDKLESDIKGGRLTNLGATFWIPLGSMETNLDGVDYPPHFILKQLSDICKYFPSILSTNGSSTSAVNNNNNNNCSTSKLLNQSHRRNSCFPANPSTLNPVMIRTTTCDRHFQYSTNNFQRQNSVTCYHHHDNNNKYRRGVSMPPIVCNELGSECENSCDSFIE